MTVLIPVICWNTASRTPTVSSGLIEGDSSSLVPACLRLTSCTSLISASMSSSLRTRLSTPRASSIRSCRISQCGLSCWKSIPTNSSTAGIAARPNISRQLAVSDSQ